MSYLVLARKYRPRNFSELVGQEHVVRALSNALTQQRLHHAYLFTGTRGVGKTTVARILAKSLNCQGADGQGGITATPCGVCQACRDIDAGRFVDYTELDAASNRSVDEVQALLEQAVYKPVMGRFKVFMIDEVHMLTGHAFNAMLKTLEEPPEYLKFVLATTDPQKVPVTVLSRCLQFSLRPMAPDTVREHLQTVLAAEGVSAEPQALQLLARAARGSMRDALSLTDQAIAFGASGDTANSSAPRDQAQAVESNVAFVASTHIQTDAVRQMLGAVDRSYAYRLIEALAQSQGAVLVDTCQALRQNGLSAAATLEEVCSVLQRMAVSQFAPQTMQVSDDADELEAQRLAALMPPDETQLLYSLCLHGRAELGLAPDEYAALTMVLLRLLAYQAPGAGNAAQSVPAPQALSELAEKKNPQIESLARSVVAPRTGVTSPAVTSLSSAQSMSRVQAEPMVQTSHPIEARKDRQAIAIPAQLVPVAPLSAAPKPPPALAADADEADPLGAQWTKTVQALIQTDAVQAMTRQLALQSCLLTQADGVWVLGVLGESLLQSDLRDKLLQALQSAGEPITALLVEQCNAEQMQPTPAHRQMAAQQAKQAAADAAVHRDPLVQVLMRDWGAKIVQGSVKPLAAV
jgi:DNA polymerase III subunit gamma/tau